jgi:hypothetical protein
MSIKATFPAGVQALTVNGLHQWDYGQSLEIVAPDLPALVEVHFACAGMLEAVVRSCHNDNGKVTAVIPDICLEQTTPVIAWVYEIDATSGKTTRTVTLPIIQRAKPQLATTIAPSTSDKYTEAVGEMNALLGELASGDIVAAEATHAAEADRAGTADQLADTLPVERGGTGVTTMKELYDQLQDIEEAEGTPIEDGKLFVVQATTTDNIAYTAEDERIEVKLGTAVIVIPSAISSWTQQTTFNLNGEGAHPVVLPTARGGVVYKPSYNQCFAAGCPVVLVRTKVNDEDLWLCMLPGRAAEAEYAAGGGSGGDATTFGGYTYSQLFTTDFNGSPIANGAQGLAAVSGGNVVYVGADQVLALQSDLENLKIKVAGLESRLDVIDP